MAAEYSGQYEVDDRLRQLARAKPFLPFDITTFNGDRYEVTDTLQLALGVTTVVLILPKVGIQIVPMSQITAVQVTEMPN
ncbi:MAG TPA: hypothetical protein VFC46_04575 [Humisphaera sp.]|nr:hypothetical protein [Humisphaera sp.]